jgi:hypothetical protein
LQIAHTLLPVIGQIGMLEAIYIQKLYKTNRVRNWLTMFILVLTVTGAVTYYFMYLTPKNSLELYQSISFAKDYKDAQAHMLKGYEKQLSQEEFEFMSRLDTSANRISQFSLFEYDEKTYILMTTPGTDRLKILRVEELPVEIRNYFMQLGP